MIEIYNNKCLVSGNRDISKISELLRIKEEVKDRQTKSVIVNTVKMYEENDDGTIEFPTGFLKFIPSYILDHSIKEVSSSIHYDLDDISNEYISQVLKGITLRSDQVDSIYKLLKYKRGLIQLPTGIGKSEIIIGLCKVLFDKSNTNFNALILEPTTILVNGTISRFKKYGINATTYNSNRGNINGIVVAHPTSLNNDLKKNPDLLNDVQVFICDEAHHLVAKTWKSLFKSLVSVEFSVGVSASVVDLDTPYISNIKDLSPEQASIVGITGDLLTNIPASYYVSRGILARPLLFRLNNKANEWISPYHQFNWMHIRSKKLESEVRSDKVAKVASYLSVSGYKSLILVSTKRHANIISKLLSKYVGEDNFRCSFGSGVFTKYSSDSDSLVKCNSEEDTIKMYESGELKILIGTSHIYEGADIPNLDAVILASVGKQSRRIIQGTGRAIRRTKTGKYAYIIDFTDVDDVVLSKHSRERRNIYTEVIGFNESDIYDMISFEVFKYLFLALEKGDKFTNE